MRYGTDCRIGSFTEMGFLEMLGFGKDTPPPVNELLQNLSRRAERLDPKQQVETFVSLGIERALLNSDNRVIFGRRGTGKTHVMSYIAQQVRKKGDLVIQIDLRNIGSNGALYSDTRLSRSERATRLLRDFLQALHDEFLDAFTTPDSRHDLKRLNPLVEELDSAIKDVVVVDSIEVRHSTEAASEATLGGEVKGKANLLGGSVSGKAKGEVSESGGTKREVVETGKSRLSVNIGQSNRTLREIVNRTGGRIWLLIDEWSTLPEELQPYFADFIKRAFFPVREYTVHIAAIEHRSRFREGSGATTIGIELGADASGDIDLDDYLVFENNPERSLEFFKELIYRHVAAVSSPKRPLTKNVDEFVQLAFTQERALKELIRASEGVPRDAIHILQKAATRSVDQKISIPTIQSAASHWYQQDKAANISEYEEGLAFLQWLIKKVIGARKCRAFLARSDARSPVLDRLFDERILHIAKKSYSAKQEPGVRYKVWKLDYGCYVDLFNTASAPTGFLFEEAEPEGDWTLSVPQDDLRAIRRAVLDLDEFAKELRSSPSR